jgi:hypothetical protein
MFSSFTWLGCFFLRPLRTTNIHSSSLLLMLAVVAVAGIALAANAADAASIGAGVEL